MESMYILFKVKNDVDLCEGVKVICPDCVVLCVHALVLQEINAVIFEQFFTLSSTIKKMHYSQVFQVKVCEK